MRRELTEQQKRFLARLACLMMEGANCDVSIQLRSGGIREYLESKRFTHEQFPPPDAALMSELQRTASRGD